MPVLFQSKPGSVVQLSEPVAQCTASGFNLLGLPAGQSIDFNSFRAIITRVTLSQQVNVQFLHTLGAMVYVYVFGDKIGSVSLSGLSFFGCPCPSPSPSPAAGNNDIYAWYKTNRASKNPKPLRVTIGTAVIEGFVTTFSEDVVDPTVNLVQWGVSMVCLPETN
jgi:hypothetical protein